MKNKITILRFSLVAFLFLAASLFGQTVTLSVTPNFNEDTGTATITATASPAPGAGVTVTVTISDAVAPGTATGGGTDYTLNSTTITIIGDGSTTTGTTTISPTSDALFEGDETIVIDITAVSDNGGVGYTESGTQQVTTTINDAETISISRDNASIAEDGTSTVTYTASVDGGGTVANGTVTVTMGWTGTATSGTDYTGAGDITIANGASSGTVVLTSATDLLFEGDETIIGTGSASYGSMGTTSATTTITDDETISISRNNASIAEDGASTVTYTASVDGGGTVANGAVTVTMSWTGTATSGTDYTGAGDITIANGASSGTVVLTSATDLVLEGDETIIGTATALTYGSLNTTSATSSITDNEQASLSSPANGATGQSLAPTLTWNDMLGADQYILEVYVDNAGSPGASVFNKTDISDDGTTNPQSYTLNTPDSTLEDNTTYHWRVAAKNTSIPVTSAYSGYYTFTTSQQGLTTTTIGDGAVDVSITPTLNWDAVTGADKYLLTVGTTSGGSDILNNSDVGNSTSHALSGLSYNTNYYWSVTAQNATGNVREGEEGTPIQTSAERSFRTLLATPALSSPANNATTTDRTPTLSWTMASSTSGVTYDLVYTFNGGAATTVSGLTSTSYTFPSNLAWGRYTWKIVAHDGTGLSGSFNTDTQSSTYTLDIVPTLVAPLNGLTGVPIEPKMEWQDGGSIDYTIQITTTSGNYTSPVVEKTVNSVTSYQFLETDTGMPLSNNTTYYWRLKISAGSGSYIYSNEWQFKTWPNMTITHGWPTASATVYTTNTTFSWSINTTVGSLKFKPQIVASTTAPTTSGWAAATLTTTTTSLNTSFSLNGGTQYYWRVIVLNSSNQTVAYSTPTTFTTSGGTNVTLYPSWPTGGNTVYTTTPTAYWYLDTYATGLTYQIRYATNNSVDGSGMLNDASAANYPTSTGSFSSNQYITFPTLTAGTTYYWQVRAYYSTTTSYSNWSSVESFKVNNPNAVVTPTPSYPTGGVTVYTSSPTLYWYLGTNATGLSYEIDYAKQSVGVDGTADVTSISNLYYQLSGLTPGETYEWRVRSTDGSTTSSWSSTETFVVDGGVSSAAVVASWPTGNPTVYTTKPTLSWYLNGSSAGLTGYRVKYSTSSETWSSFPGGSPSATKGQIDITGVSNTTTTLTVDLTYGQKYYWAVAATDGSSYTSYSEGSFTIVGGSTAGTPILSSPIGGITVYSTSQTLYWYFNGSTLGIQGYEVKYSKTGFLSDSTTVSSALSSTSTSASVTGLTPGATYSWKVRAFYGGSTYGSYSSVATFTVDAGAAPVQPLIGGPNNVTITTASPVASWVLPVQSQSQLKYELLYSTSEDMSNAQTIDNISQPFSSIPGLEAGQTYYWKVRSVTNDGVYSDYSPKASFSTDQTTKVEDEMIVPDKFLVEQNYPNPFNPSTIIRFGIPEGQFVSVRIYNMLGQEVRTLVKANMNAGTYELQWNGKDNNGNAVTSGAYIYRVVAGNNVITKKMLLLK